MKLESAGAAAIAMRQAISPYAGWLDAAATKAAHAATQAAAAANAHQSAAAGGC